MYQKIVHQDYLIPQKSVNQSIDSLELSDNQSKRKQSDHSSTLEYQQDYINMLKLAQQKKKEQQKKLLDIDTSKYLKFD